MPNNLPVIVGIKDPKQLRQFESMLSAVGVPDGVKQIFVQNPIALGSSRRMLGIADSHPSFSVGSMGRVYIPDDVVNNPNLVDKYLLHEFGHFAGNAMVNGAQSNLNLDQRMALENKAENAAKPFRDAYKVYRNNQKSMDANYDLQSRIVSQQGQFQPVTAPLSPLHSKSISQLMTGFGAKK